MNIAELTKALKAYVDRSQGELEKILEEPVREYLRATLADRDWFAAVMHTSGSEVDEAVRLSRKLEAIGLEELAGEVTHRMAAGIVSTTLMPSLLPNPLVNAVNQALLASLRDSGEDERTFKPGEDEPSPV